MEKEALRRARLHSKLAAVSISGCVRDNAVERALAVIARTGRLSTALAAAAGLFLAVRGTSYSMTLRQVADKFNLCEKQLRRCLSKLRKANQGEATEDDCSEKSRRDEDLVVPSATCQDTLSVLERLWRLTGAKAGVLRAAREFVMSESLSGNLPSTVAAGALALGLQAHNEPVDYQKLSDFAGISKQTLLCYLSKHALAPQQSELLSAKRIKSKAAPAEMLVQAILSGEPCDRWDLSLLDDMKRELATQVDQLKGPRTRECLSC